MIYGFTGTRQDTTCEQHHALCEWAKKKAAPKEFHHGCCVGADLESLSIVRTYWRETKIHGHPPTDTKLIAHGAKAYNDVEYPPLSYLERNKAIVDACGMLIACPKGDEELRSGTWSTIRYARKKGKPIVIFWPDGMVTTEGM